MNMYLMETRRSLTVPPLYTMLVMRITGNYITQYFQEPDLATHNAGIV